MVIGETSAAGHVQMIPLELHEFTLQVVAQGSIKTLIWKIWHARWHCHMSAQIPADGNLLVHRVTVALSGRESWWLT